MLSSYKRETRETSIEIALETEGTGTARIETGIVLLDEILSAMARASRFDLTVKARGDLQTGDHHTVEDTGIALGSAIGEVIKSGMGSASVPLGQSLAMAAIRFGEPGYRGEFDLQAGTLGGVSLQNIGHFFRSLAYNGRFTLFICAEGGSESSKVEAMSLALGRALRIASLDS